MDDMLFTDWLGERSLTAYENELDHMMSLTSEEPTASFAAHGEDQHPSLRWLPNMDTPHTNISPAPGAGPDPSTQDQNIDFSDFTRFGIDDKDFEFEGIPSKSSVIAVRFFKFTR